MKAGISPPSFSILGGGILKISQVTVNEAINNAKEDATDTDVIRDFTNFLAAGKHFIKSYTGLSEGQMDDREDLTIALFVLINDMHDNRSYVVKDDKLNPTVKTILNMHSVNLL